MPVLKAIREGQVRVACAERREGVGHIGAIVDAP